ncbi:hypothetical protein ACP70R_034900 [Stipagrostis hirtigluma subsp. patula]
MERAYQKFVLLGILIHAAIITGGCFPSNQKGNRTAPWPSKFHPQFYGSNGEKTSSEDPAAFIYASSHVVFPGDGTSYYGVEATIDVYGLTLESDQLSQAGVWIVNRGDGQPTSFYGFQAGWQIWPAVYKDSRTHFFTSWISGGPDKDCLNMNCPGFQKTSSNIVPGDVISPVSDNSGSKQCITIRLFKDKPTGDWHVHYGFNGAPKPVGYVPKSLLPGMIDKQVEINFGGLVFHRKPQPSPPMGNGFVPESGHAASFSGLMLIDEDGNNHPVNTDLPVSIHIPCYPISSIDSEGRFSYGGPGCDD